MNRPSQILAESTSPPLVTRFAPRGHMLAAGYADGRLDVWTVDRAPRLLGQGAQSDPVADVLYSPRLSLLVARTTRHLRGWAVPDVRETFAWDVGPLDDALFLPDGNHVLAAGEGRLRVIDLRDGQTVRECLQSVGSIARVALDSARGGLVALVRDGADTRLEMRSLETFESLSTAGLPASTRAFTLAPDGVRCAVSNGQIAVVDRADGRSHLALEAADAGASGSWSTPAFSAEGRLLIAGGPSGRIHVWDTARGRTLFVLDGHAGPVTTLDLLHGRSTVASGGADGTVRLWDLARR